MNCRHCAADVESEPVWALKAGFWGFSPCVLAVAVYWWGNLPWVSAGLVVLSGVLLYRGGIQQSQMGRCAQCHRKTRVQV